MHKQENMLIVAYDIVSDRRRTRVAKLLSGYGFRVNRSVFACQVPDSTVAEIKKKTACLVDRHEDSILFFRLCGHCQCWAKEYGGLTLPGMLTIF